MSDSVCFFAFRESLQRTGPSPASKVAMATHPGVPKAAYPERFADYAYGLPE